MSARANAPTRAPTRAHRRAPRPRATLSPSSSSIAYADVVRERVDALLATRAQKQKQLLVAVAGPPGWGKSTLAEAVRDAYNARRGRPDACVVVPMDGFHYSLEELDARPDALELRRRRGAPWTFDAHAFAKCVRELRERGFGDVPTFDHATHDPEPGGLRVVLENEVLLVEGNYVLLP